MSSLCSPRFEHQRWLGPALLTGSTIQLHVWSFRSHMRGQTAICLLQLLLLHRRRLPRLRASLAPAKQHNVGRQTFPPKWALRKAVFWLQESLLGGSFTRLTCQAPYTPIPHIPIGETISILNPAQPSANSAVSQYCRGAVTGAVGGAMSLWLVLDWCIHTTLIYILINMQDSYLCQY